MSASYTKEHNSIVQGIIMVLVLLALFLGTICFFAAVWHSVSGDLISMLAAGMGSVLLFLSSWGLVKAAVFLDECVDA